MSDVFTTTPDLTPYTAIIPGILCRPPVDPTLVPECNNADGREVTAAVKPLHDGAWWAKATQGFNFKRPDLNNADLFNLVLWRGIMGDDKPYPGAGNQQASNAPRQISAAALKTVAGRD
jgi:DNA-binding beta-propeller fold protein YncE